MVVHTAKLDLIIRGIVMTRGDNGATIAEISSDYYNIFLERWPLFRLETDQIVQYLMEIDGLMMIEFKDGPYIWYIDDIGSNISERDLDKNNNNSSTTNNNAVISITETSSDGTVISTEPNSEAQSNSYLIVPSCNPRRMVTSSFVNGSIVSASSAETLNFIESIESVSENVAKKRRLSKCSEVDENTEKRSKVQSTLPLLEMNLDFHNRNGGTLVKQATSTEKENSLIVNGGSNGFVEVLDANDYIRTMHDPQSKRLTKVFSKQCQVQENSSTDQAETVETTMSEDDDLFQQEVGIIGDDFMRNLISCMLYGADFTNEKDSKFSFCISGQTLDDALALVLDKSNQFRSKYEYVLVNVGAIDILLLKDLTDIQVKYVQLVNAIVSAGCKPIITTIPTMLVSPNNPNQRAIYQTLLLLNSFLVDTFGPSHIPVIDLYSWLPTVRNILDNSMEFNIYYRTQPKRLKIKKTNRALELWLWTEIGRNKIFDAIDVSIRKLTSSD